MLVDYKKVNPQPRRQDADYHRCLWLFAIKLVHYLCPIWFETIQVPNLAGLARSCEVFQAAALAVPDLRVVRDAVFGAVSVTAERWVPLIEVPPAALPDWLEARRQNGYKVLGLEQTTNSCPLPQSAFPVRCQGPVIVR